MDFSTLYGIQGPEEERRIQEAMDRAEKAQAAANRKLVSAQTEAERGVSGPAPKLNLRPGMSRAEYDAEVARVAELQQGQLGAKSLSSTGSYSDYVSAKRDAAKAWAEAAATGGGEIGDAARQRAGLPARMGAGLDEMGRREGQVGSAIDKGYLGREATSAQVAAAAKARATESKTREEADAEYLRKFYAGIGGTLFDVGARDRYTGQGPAGGGAQSQDLQRLGQMYLTNSGDTDPRRMTFASSTALGGVNGAANPRQAFDPASGTWGANPNYRDPGASPFVPKGRAKYVHAPKSPWGK